MRQERFHVQEGYRLAHDGMSQVLARATAYITRECQNIDNTNQPEIAILRAKYRSLYDRRRQLVRDFAAHSHRAQQVHTTESNTWSLMVAVSLIAAAFFIAVKTIEPFRMGWMGDAWCLALVIALPYSLDRFLQDFRHRAVIGVLSSTALVAAFATALLFGMLRGDVLARMLDAEPVVVIDGLSVRGTSEKNVEDMIASFRRLWGLAALVFELVAGMALHRYLEARRLLDFAALRRLQKELLAVEKDLRQVLRRLREVLSQSRRTAAAFWAAFDRGDHDARSRNGGLRRLALVVAMLLAAGTVEATDKLYMIDAIDLSASEQATNNRRKTEFEENIRTVSAVIANSSAGSRLTVIGITNRSYANPLVLLEARTAADRGSFSNRLTAARRTLVSEWMKRAQSLKPSYNETDVLGAFLYAGEVFARSDGERKVLLVLSDVRNYTPELDLETPKVIDVDKSLKQVEKQRLFAALGGVEVFIIGAGDHSGKRGTAYAVSLRSFWRQFIERSGGALKVFSTTREAGVLSEIYGSENREGRK